MMSALQSDYMKSNAIESVVYNKLSKKEYSELLNSKSDRALKAQKLLDYLCDKFAVNRIKLVVLNKGRKISGKSQTYGFYKFCNKKGISITIYNKTAKTDKEVSIKTFASTLLHEFMHHYDTEFLQIYSNHTCGFYKRISDLEKKLKK
jgi:hypothetical protein